MNKHCYTEYVTFSSIRRVDPFTVMGIFFAVSQIFIVSTTLYDPTRTIFLIWSCNNFCIFLAYACHKKNMQMLMGVSYLGLVSQLLWVSDFLSHGLGFDLSGIANYLFIEGFTYANKISTGVHLIIPIAILLFSFRIKPKLSSFLYAVPYVVLLYGVTLALTPAIEDINCVFSGCGNGQYILFNVYLWLPYALVSVLLSYGLHSFLYYGWRKVNPRLGFPNSRTEN
jgi:hypothetical protein